MTRFRPVPRLLARLGVVAVRSTTLLLTVTGVSLAAGSGGITTIGAGATVNIAGTGFGASAQISVSNVDVTGR